MKKFYQAAHTCARTQPRTLENAWSIVAYNLAQPFYNGSATLYNRSTSFLNGYTTGKLYYGSATVVDEEKDIYIPRRARRGFAPTQPGTAQLSPSATSVSLNLYELANCGHTVVYTKGQKGRSRHFTVHPDNGELRNGIRAVSSADKSAMAIRGWENLFLPLSIIIPRQYSCSGLD